MRFVARQEIEYLSATDMMADRDASLIDELTRRLDALRRYDQHFFRADWSPPQRNGRPFNGDVPHTGGIS